MHSPLQNVTRRSLLSSTAQGLGATALAAMIAGEVKGTEDQATPLHTLCPKSKTRHLSLDERCSPSHRHVRLQAHVGEKWKESRDTTKRT